MVYLFYVLGFYALIILSQGLFIFPGAVLSLFNKKRRNPDSLPADVESSFVQSTDGKNIEVWKMNVMDQDKKLPYVAIVFHGNGASLENFFLTQLFFQEMGIVSYGFDYRGFGKSSGWPSESGIWKDSEAVWHYVTTRENLEPTNVIVLGVSVGGAPAARLACLHQPRLLILVSAFTTLKQVVLSKFSTILFAPFLFFRFPTIEYVRGLKSTKLIVASSTRDNIVPPSHSEKLTQAYKGDALPIHLTCSDSGHNGVFYSLRRELKEAVRVSLANN